MSFFGSSRVPAPAEPNPDLQEEQNEQIPELPEARGNTVIAKDIVLTGKLSGEGVVQIEGTVEGEVSLKGYVIVTATGAVRGPVEADVIRVAGRVEGSVVCRDHLQLERTGTIEGDVSTASFVIENGGRLNGRTTMTELPEKNIPRVDTGAHEDLKFGKNYQDHEEE